VKHYFLFFVFTAFYFTISAQQEHTLLFPEESGWTILQENQEISFPVKTMFETRARFSIIGAEDLNIHFDTLGNFYWRPSFDLVDRVTKVKDFPVIFQATFPNGKRDRKTITFTVHHVNRPPVVEEMPVFYVKQGVRNTYQIPSDYVYDPDGDPIVFKPVASNLPEGANVSSTGQFIWTPSRSQFASLRSAPAAIEFVVQDQPDKAETTGKLKIAQTQLDLPPEILIVPVDSVFTIKEDETLNLKIYVSDPNGDDNVKSTGFIPGDLRIPKTVFKENTPIQYEFTWTPGYSFVEEAQKNMETEIVFFALDKTNNRAQRKIKIRVADAENLVEKDALQFRKYRNNLASAMVLLNQLDDNQKKLNLDYKKARKGKKNRSILNATFGAATGLSPVAFEPDQAKIVSGIGGTTVLTLGTLEATEVIGRSKEAIMEKIKIGIELRNKIQSSGDEFARKYALKSSRRLPEFEKDIDKLRAAMNDQRLVLLELDAFSRNNAKTENRDIKRVFIDFNEE
jgi:hypothetical protein